MSSIVRKKLVSLQPPQLQNLLTSDDSDADFDAEVEQNLTLLEAILSTDDNLSTKRDSGKR